MKNKGLFVLLFPLLLFVILTILVLTVDKGIVGDANIEVGLSTINRLYYRNIQFKAWDIISDICMGFSIALVFVMIAIGIYQLIKRKSLYKVDKIIIVLGILIVLAFILWILFDKVLVINYRPLLVDGMKEGSYPSTHVMMVSFMTLSCTWILIKKTNKRILEILSCVFTSALIVIICIGRLLSGMHWITDVAGGLLLGFGLSFVLILIDCYFIPKEKI